VVFGAISCTHCEFGQFVNEGHMKKQRKNVRRKTKSTHAQTTEFAVNAATPNRRDFLKYLRVGGIGALILGGGGYYGISTVNASIAEHDLSKIGNGTPAVVQIHDPQCPVCRALQKEVRHALKQFENGEMEYLVADIRTSEGADLANAYVVPHITLLLFDGNGQMLKVLRGSKKHDELYAEFKSHLKALR
jgi:hypothetical protein